MPDFEEILNKPMDDIQKPKAKPIGTFTAVIQGHPKFKKVKPRDGGDDMDVISFNLKRTGVIEADNPDSLEDHPPVHEWPNMTHDIFVHNEQGQWQFKRFVGDVLGIDTSGKTPKEVLAETPGKQLVVKTKHEAYISREGESGISDRIESVAHV